ncbi:MAG: helix-turn-helix domain-containing protein [Bacillota bacterium]
MQRKPKLLELIVKTQNVEEDALTQVDYCFIPLSRSIVTNWIYAEAYSDLVIWVICAVHRYKPQTIFL